MTITDKFELRLLTGKESQLFYTLIENNRSRLEDFFAGTTAKTRTLSATQEYCKIIEERISKKEYFPYLIIDKQSNQPVGLIDVKNIDWNIPKGELGAFIDANFEGRGLITALTTSLIDQIVAEHQFKKLYCRVAPQNTRSVRVMERIGFDLEGTIRRDYKTTRGEIVDLNYYGKLFD